MNQFVDRFRERSQQDKKIPAGTVFHLSKTIELYIAQSVIEKGEAIRLTWAHGDVAELGLFGEAFARLSSVLGRLAVAGAVAVAPAAGRRAQAPRRPLIPGSIHCTWVTEKKGIL